MTDPRFQPLPAPSRHCLACEHHEWAGKDIECHHPDRPADSRKVIKWFGGCGRFTKKETV